MIIIGRGRPETSAPCKPFGKKKKKTRSECATGRLRIHRRPSAVFYYYPPARARARIARNHELVRAARQVQVHRRGCRCDRLDDAIFIPT